MLSMNEVWRFGTSTMHTETTLGMNVLALCKVEPVLVAQG